MRDGCQSGATQAGTDDGCCRFVRAEGYREFVLLNINDDDAGNLGRNAIESGRGDKDRRVSGPGVLIEVADRDYIQGVPLNSQVTGGNIVAREGDRNRSGIDVCSVEVGEDKGFEIPTSGGDGNLQRAIGRVEVANFDIHHGPARVKTLIEFQDAGVRHAELLAPQRNVIDQPI